MDRGAWRAAVHGVTKAEVTQCICTSNLNSFLDHLFPFLVLGSTFSFTGEECVGLASGDGV